MQVKRFLLLLVLFITVNSIWGQKAKPIYTKKVYFEFNKWDIRTKDKKALTAMLRAIKSQKQPYYLVITGHTDNIDNNNYNYTLGMKRAKAVAAYLTKRGADSSKMQLYSKGEEQSAVDNSTDSLRLLNRRVEIQLYRDKSLQKEGLTTIDSAATFILRGKIVDSLTGEPLKGQILLFSEQKGREDRLLHTYFNTDTFSKPIYNTTYKVSYTAKNYRTKNISYNFVDSSFANGSVVEVEAKLKKLKIKRKESFEKIYFYGNEARFLPTSGAELRRLLALAKSPDISAIEIVGHVNYPYYYDQENEFYIRFNYQLSFNRARAVYNYLVGNGVSKDIITYKGVANTEMKFPNTRRESEMQQNRRVEVLILEEGN